MLMLTKKKKGFTLLEIVVAMAIFSICVTMGLGIMSYALEQKVVNTAVLSIQDAFSSASATMVKELKAATWPDYTGGTANAFIVAPANAATTNELIFLTGTQGMEYRIRYYLDTTSSPGATRILKEKGRVPSTTDPNALDQSTTNTDPVTPYINQPVTISFVNNNGKITVIMGAKLKTNGQENDIAYVATAYVSNYVPLLPVGPVTGAISSPATIGVTNTLYPYTASGGGGQYPYTYLWSNGGTDQTSQYSWATVGPHTPIVTVTDAYGQRGTAKISVTIQSTLTVIINPGGAGTVTPAGGAYDVGTPVTLTASPVGAYNFSSWSGEASGTDPTTTVTMDGDRTVTANFTIIPSP